MKICFVTCSSCGKQVSNAVESSLSEGIVVRATVICPECQTLENLEDDTNNPHSMKAEDIVASEIARQAEFGYEPSWLDFAIAGREAGRKEVVEYINDSIIGIGGCNFEERLDGDKGCIVLDMNENHWQAKQKEWGLTAIIK